MCVLRPTHLRCEKLTLLPVPRCLPAYNPRCARFNHGRSARNPWPERVGDACACPEDARTATAGSTPTAPTSPDGEHVWPLTAPAPPTPTAAADCRTPLAAHRPAACAPAATAPEYPTRRRAHASMVAVCRALRSCGSAQAATCARVAIWQFSLICLKSMLTDPILVQQSSDATRVGGVARHSHRHASGGAGSTVQESNCCGPPCQRAAASMAAARMRLRASRRWCVRARAQGHGMATIQGVFVCTHVSSWPVPVRVVRRAWARGNSLPRCVRVCVACACVNRTRSCLRSRTGLS